MAWRAGSRCYGKKIQRGKAMTDKELLALAAKAVGGLLYVHDMDAWIAYDEATGARGSWWDPLTDDGDALRRGRKPQKQALCGKIEGILGGATCSFCF